MNRCNATVSWWSRGAQCWANGLEDALTRSRKWRSGRFDWPIGRLGTVNA